MNSYGIRLADGTFVPGGLGTTRTGLELTISNEDASKYLIVLMNPEKTKVLKFYTNKLDGEYEDYEFEKLVKDALTGKVNIWLKKKGEI